MNYLSMHQVTAIAFDPVAYLSAMSNGQDSYYVKLRVTQRHPCTNAEFTTELVLHSDKPLRLGIPN